MVVLSRNSTVVSAIWLGLHKKGAILNQDRLRGKGKSSAIHSRQKTAMSDDNMYYSNSFSITKALDNLMALFVRNGSND